MTPQSRRAFLVLILAQAAHSTEEYVFRLFDVFAPARFVSSLPSRHTRTRPLRNPYLHAAVVTGVAIQFTAASLPLSANLLGNAAIPLEV
jgi:hypothetical protein